MYADDEEIQKEPEHFRGFEVESTQRAHDTEEDGFGFEEDPQGRVCPRCCRLYEGTPRAIAEIFSEDIGGVICNTCAIDRRKPKIEKHPQTTNPYFGGQ